MPGSHPEHAEQSFPGRDQQLGFREWQEKFRAAEHGEGCAAAC